MAFPTVPSGGQIVSANRASVSATLTSPDLSTLTKSSGDLLIAIAVDYGCSQVNAWQTWGGGFTEFADFSASGSMPVGCAYKWSDGTETGTFTVTQAGSIGGQATMIIMAIPGSDGTTAPEAGGNVTGTSATADPGSLTPSWGAADTLWIAVAGCGETSTTGSFTGLAATNPPNYTGIVATSITADVAGGINAAVAFRQINASSEDPGAFSNDTSNTRVAALTIAVRPGAGGISGTLATTLAGATLAASGTETISGTLASTLTGSTLAASGTVANPVTGTLATTMAGADLAGSGTETISGTLATSLAGATLTGAGTETISGTFATTLAGATLAAAGTETISGTFATTLDGATLSASGTAGGTGVTGTLATTLDGVTLAATGIETITGTASVQLDGATLAALATEQMAGALAVTLEDAALAGTGVEIIGGTLAATLAGATLAASGTSLLNVTGTLAVTLEGATLAAVGSGGLVVPSDIAIVLPLAHRIPVAERAHVAAVTATPSAAPVAEADHAATVAARPHRIEA